MRTLKNAAMTIMGLAPFAWLGVSWVDVLAHQFSGNPHAWNAFVILVALPKFF